MLLLVLTVIASHGAPETIQPLIRINQIGYVPEGNKVAVLADPQVGPDAELEFTPGSTYQVRHWSNDAIAFEGTPVPWNNGATHEQSGDRGWWFDFSGLTDTGSYYIWDVDNAVGSYRFEIAHDVYDDILRVASKSYFYQRLAFEKTAEFAGEAWADGPAFIGPGQDTECRSVYDRNNPDSARDLRGGWMDAGDYNKYVTFAESPVHQLLTAYRERPEAFGDSNRIPESGNGLPDILDEVHFEMQWLSRMQEPDGSVILKMGEIDFNGTTPPSSDTRPRYYVPPCSSSTIAAAGMYAHAALVFRQFDVWKAFADQLESQALAAWSWYHENPKSDSCDDQIVKAGDADRSLEAQEKSAMIAAIYLHMLTGDSSFRTYIEDNYLEPDIELEGWSGRWVYIHFLYEAFQHYMNFVGAPEAVAMAVRNKTINNEDEEFFDWTEADLYRAYMPDSQYHWGSNSVKANMGNASWNYITHNIEEVDLAERRLRAENLLHYMLGVNPLGIVYLSNMGDYGAEVSVTEFYHSWFKDGSEWDQNPAPGFVPGGPNQSYTGNYPFPVDTPPQKMYAEFNGGFSQSWEITENGIYYQSAFVKLVSKFASGWDQPLDLSDSDGDGILNEFENWFGLDPTTADSMQSKIRIEILDTIPHLTFTRQAGVDPTRILPMWSTDLQQWHTFDLTQTLTLNTENNQVTLALPLPGAKSEARYIRFVIPTQDQTSPTLTLN